MTRVPKRVAIPEEYQGGRGEKREGDEGDEGRLPHARAWHEPRMKG
jgi:hypothetical protein